MDLTNIEIITGMFFVLVILVVRIVQLKKKFLEKISLFTSIGYAFLSYLSALMIVKMVYLAYLTISKHLTMDIVLENGAYIFFVWAIAGIATLMTYVSLLAENKKD